MYEDTYFDADMHGSNKNNVEYTPLSRRNQDQIILKMTAMTSDVSWAMDSTPDGGLERDTRFRVENDHQDQLNEDAQAISQLRKGLMADEALRYQVHVGSSSRKRLAVIRLLSRWIFLLRIHHRPALDNAVDADASASYGLEQVVTEERKSCNTAQHSTQSRAGQAKARQGAAQPSTRKIHNHHLCNVTSVEVRPRMPLGQARIAEKIRMGMAREQVRLRSVVKPGRKSSLDCGHFWRMSIWRD